MGMEENGWEEEHRYCCRSRYLVTVLLDCFEVAQARLLAEQRAHWVAEKKKSINIGRQIYALH